MKYPFSEIIIIYNPKSTGESKGNALSLQTRLRKALPQATKVVTKATAQAGHAEEIGERYAKKDQKVLLISSSGDGGYNELVNGVLRHPTKHVATLVLPSGNANDHYHATKERSMLEKIIDGKLTYIDVIKIESKLKGNPWIRYAHSYVGIGLTAYIGKKLTEADLNPINEKWLTLKYLIRFSHVTVRVKGHKRRYSSIVFGNIDRMSKIIKLSQNAKLDDGKFEVYETRYRSLLRLITVLFLGSTLGLVPNKRTSNYMFSATKALELQCDGEVFLIDAGSTVSVASGKRQLRTLA